MQALCVGDPFDPDTDIGPVATEQGRADLVELVDDAVARGATVLCGGEAIDGPGWYYPPTVVAGVTPGMRIHREETFGPVATLYRVDSIDEAIAVANDTSFGLGSNAWTGDRAEQARFCDELDAGAVFVNGMTTSYPALPFGGVKTLGLRPRARRHRHPRVLQHQDDLDRLTHSSGHDPADELDDRLAAATIAVDGRVVDRDARTGATGVGDGDLDEPVELVPAQAAGLGVVDRREGIGGEHVEVDVQPQRSAGDGRERGGHRHIDASMPELARIGEARYDRAQ